MDNTIETSRTTEILDDFGALRYKVSYTDLDDPGSYCPPDDLRYKGMNYAVQVISYAYNRVEGTVIVNDLFAERKPAFEYYNRMVDLYSKLSKAETRNYQDIDIYARKIGYKVIDPDRCANCKYALRNPESYKPRPHHEHFHYHKPLYRYFCMNEKLYVIDEIENETNCRKPKFPIHPEVSEVGICDHYERLEPPCHRLENRNL